MTEHTPLDTKTLDAIRERDRVTLERHIDGDQALPWKRVLLDRRELLAEIERLRSELDTVTKDRDHFASALEAALNPESTVVPETDMDKLNEFISDESPPVEIDQDMGRLAAYVSAFQHLRDMPPKELVDIALRFCADSAPSSAFELVIEELCSRVHPNWPNEDSELPLVICYGCDCDKSPARIKQCMVECNRGISPHRTTTKPLP